jgi:hypothetical protein
MTLKKEEYATLFPIQVPELEDFRFALADGLLLTTSVVPSLRLIYILSLYSIPDGDSH